VVTFACDTGNKYLSKLFNDFWLEDEGFKTRDPLGDLRDLIGRRHDEHATVCVGPQDLLVTAHNRLRNAGFSQLPVMDGDRLVGVLTEADIIAYVYGQPERMNAPIADAMQTEIHRVEQSMPVDQLVARLRTVPYTAVMDGGRFLGLITRSDVLNHLRKQLRDGVATHHETQEHAAP
jgi:cystathionine beta-synthase